MSKKEFKAEADMAKQRSFWIAFAAGSAMLVLIALMIVWPDVTRLENDTTPAPEPEVTVLQPEMIELPLSYVQAAMSRIQELEAKLAEKDESCVTPSALGFAGG